MKYNNEVFEKLNKKIEVYSAIRRYEQKFKAYTPETIFYFLAAKNGIKISKYVDEKTLEKVDELLERDKNPERNKQKKRIVVKSVGKKNPYDFPLSKFEIDEELIKDCKLIKPYRSCIREALLTLETKIKRKLKTRKNGKALIQECNSRGVFEREEPSEKEGLFFLFMGAIEWLRNPPSHNKINYEKEDAIKIILFTDHLIKLFFELCKKNKI